MKLYQNLTERILLKIEHIQGFRMVKDELLQYDITKNLSTPEEMNKLNFH